MEGGEKCSPLFRGRKLLSLMPQAYDYLKNNGRCWEDYQNGGLTNFEVALTTYLEVLYFSFHITNC
jgi:hypothetical protein